MHQYRPRRRLIALVTAVMVAMAIPDSAMAWGREGHFLTSSLAEERLTPAARQALNDLLAQEPGSSLTSISTWADEVRSSGTAPWHYLNFARGERCEYVAERHCASGNCLVGALDRQISLLRTARDPAERLKALKYVVHFVADAHQPLHAGYADDRGGNLYQVQAFGRGSNLHAAWDVALIERWPGGTESLRAMVRQAMPGAAPGSVSKWAEESCGIVGQPGFYPEGHLLGSEYRERWAAVLVRRLAEAAVRLAAVLNDLLVPAERRP